MQAATYRFLRICNTSNIFRSASSGSEEGIKYFGFTYYPRFPKRDVPEDQAPPSKLFMVKRIKPVKGNPYWEKKILKALHLDGKDSEIAIVKNIPENNARLWKIKHLIKITPITFPNGEPSANDIGGTYLKENGEFLVSQRLKIDTARLEAGESFERDTVDVDGTTLQKQLRLQWINPWHGSQNEY